MADDLVRFFERLSEGAVSAAVGEWVRRFPRGAVFALVAEANAEEVPALQSLCRAVGYPLLGGVFPGLIHQNGFSARGFWLISFPRCPAAILIDDLTGDPAVAAARIATALEPHLDAAERPTLFLMFDAALPTIGSILDELYLSIADAAQYLGVNAGSETIQPTPCLFDTERRVTQGVLGMLLPGCWPKGLVHGYRAQEESVVATATQGNKVISIGWQPAFPVYRDKVRARYGVTLDRDSFYHYAVHFPFGIALASGEILVRIPVALDDQDAIICAGEIPSNALLTLLQSPRVDSSETARNLGGLLHGQRPGDPVLVFYCAGRQLHLGEAAEREVALCAREFDAVLVGARSLGEIGSIGQGAYPVYHNGALVGLRWIAEAGERP